MSPLTLDDAEKGLAELPGTFFSTDAAAERLGMRADDARSLLAEMESRSLARRVCRDGWVLTWSGGEARCAPTLVAYLDDMMRYLGVAYYVSYEAAAQFRGVADRWASRNRVNIEVDDDWAMDALQLRPAYGPHDSVVRCHRIDPGHGRPVAMMARMCWPTGDDSCAARPERRQVRVATAETTLLDMVESPERSGGLPGIAAIARRMLWEHSLHPRLLAEAAARYEPQVAARTGSLLQQLRGYRRWISLWPLMRQVRSTRTRPRWRCTTTTPSAAESQTAGASSTRNRTTPTTGCPNTCLSGIRDARLPRHGCSGS